MTYEQMTIPQLEAEINRRNNDISRLRAEMPEIRGVIDRKTAHWLAVGRFEGWTEDEKRGFAKLTQGVSLR